MSSLCLLSQWFNLKDVPSGSVHLRLEWLSLLPSAARLCEVRVQQSSMVQILYDFHFPC